MSETKRFDVVCINCGNVTPDFSEVIDYLKELKFSRDQIERMGVVFYDIGSVEVIIRKVNPPGKDLATIKLVGYSGFEDYSFWDARGAFRIILNEVIEKVFV